MHARVHGSARRRWALLGALAPVLVPVALTGCGGDDGGVPTLTWYTNPDDGGQATLAQECGDASGGAYRIRTEVLPNDASGQREQLVRRLAATGNRYEGYVVWINALISGAGGQIITDADQGDEGP